MVQLSHPYMTTGKTIALTRQTFVSKLMFLLFNTLYRFVIAFFPKEQASTCHDVIGLDTMGLLHLNKLKFNAHNQEKQ